MKDIQHLFLQLGVDPTASAYLSGAILIVGIGILSILANYMAKKVVLKVLAHYIRHNRFQWDNIVLERKVFEKLSHIVPAVIIYYGSGAFPAYRPLILKGVTIYLIIIGLFVAGAFLNAVNDIYRTYEISKTRPIRGYLQVVNIFLFIIGVILIIANLIGESPLILLSYIGALSAVFLLVFKDSLLGLAAGIQLSSNDMVRVGDWIEMPKYAADGEIIDISLNTVKIQNWDKTITSIPSYALISDSFKNWRGMQSAGGRRLKRALYLDTGSIAFCTEDDLAEWRQVHYLADYLARKEREIQTYNAENRINPSNPVNGRALTNIGVFREYVEQYLRHHPKIHQEMTLMVRQLEPGETGLPLEIYAFTNTTDWGVYERVQADIFDHLFAVVPAFGLRVFQSPSGHDVRGMAPRLGTR